tara:strand:+ start:100 stop:633 length:534 start_codon:yes stop_codon:yes gene_type:complete
MNVEKIEANLKVPFIQFQLPNFSDMKQDIIDAVEKDAVPNKFDANFPDALRTPWFILKYKSIKWLADQITDHVGRFDKCKEGTLICDEIWGIITQSTKATLRHNHYPATWSAVAYISCPEGSGETVWPEIGKKVKPYDGTVCLFPGYLSHYVESSGENIRRIIVSCNIYTNRRNENG